MSRAENLPSASLMIVTPPVTSAETFAPRLARALSTSEVAAVLLRLAPADERTQIRIVKELSAIAQGRDAALIVAASPTVAIRGGADGAHLVPFAEARADQAEAPALSDDGDGPDEDDMPQLEPAPASGGVLSAARTQLTPSRILGAGGLKSRHDAMDAGESGVDYVMFGEPRADGSLPAFSSVLDRAAWWAEIFQVPCVAYAPDAASVALLVDTGVEFVALGDWIFAEGTDTATAIAAAAAILSRTSVQG
jgi:thiamine-phosphate pyrophosphorylase